ncbi:MAG: DUF885 domain-containing protein [Anaerolineae bacterium]|nr:DUF885 domain-containing protein [Anaerolineae bacterium]
MREERGSVTGWSRQLARGARWVVVVGLTALLAAACGPSASEPQTTPVSPTEDASPTVAATIVAPTRVLGEDATPATPTVASPDALFTDPGSFDAFVEQAYVAQVERDPELVTEYGLAESLGMDNSRLTDLSDAYQLETFALHENQQAALHRFDRAALSPEQQLTYDLFAWQLEDSLAGRSYRFYNHPVKQVLGVHEQLLELMTDRHPMRVPRDAEDYVARLERFRVKIDQLLLWLEAQHALGIVMPAFAIRNVIWQMDQFVELPAEKTELYTVFAQKLDEVDGLDDGARAALLDRARMAIREVAQPAYRKLQEHFRGLQADAPPEGGLYGLSEGAAAYAYALRHHTTTDLTADEIHALGLEEVTRIQAEMARALDALGIEDGDLAGRIGQVAMQSGSVSAVQVLDVYTQLIGDANRNLAPWFETGPQAQVVMASFEYGGAAYYVPPSLDGSRPGMFYVGVGAPSWRFSMPTLAYHEAVPGHHLQLALAQELAGLPTFRRTAVHTAYAEGWALYAERLAWEAGWYAQDPYGNIGRLQAELFRAARLVVDTGIHAQGWTRQEAVDYMIEEGGQPPARAGNEVERYILWPGQATAYKVGMLKMMDLREKAETALADDFDICEFHSRLLMEGSLPLSILDERVVAWLDQRHD